MTERITGAEAAALYEQRMRELRGLGTLDEGEVAILRLPIAVTKLVKLTDVLADVYEDRELIIKTVHNHGHGVMVVAHQSPVGIYGHMPPHPHAADYPESLDDRTE